MPCLRQMSEIVNPLAKSWSPSRNERTTSLAVLCLLVSPSVAHANGRLSFRLDQFLGSTALCDSGPARPGRASGRVMVRRPEAEASADDPGDAIDAIVG
jgi:hypothetical protein